MANKNTSKPLVQSRIPIPVTRNVSKIPIRVPLVKGKPRSALIEKLPKQNVNIIKPIISKRRSPNIKDIPIISTKSKLIVKQKEVLKKQSIAKCLKQTVLPPSYIKPSKNVRAIPTIVVQGWCEKENAPPMAVESIKKDFDVHSSEHKNLSALKAQQCLNIVFEANEDSLKQILTNKRNPALTSGSLQGQKNSLGRSSNINLEELRKLSISRSSRAKKSPATPKINPFRESAYDICKAVKEIKKAQMESPFRRGSVGASQTKSRPDPYEVAMASIRRMNAARANNYSATRMKSSLSCEKNLPSGSRPLDKKIEAFKANYLDDGTSLLNTPPSPIRQSTFVIDKVATPTEKLIQSEEAKSVYRPFKNLMFNSAFKEKKKRLTDISEHSENDGSTRSVRSSLASPIQLENNARPSNILFSLKGGLQHCDAASFNSPITKLQGASAKTFPPNHLHTPRPISLQGENIAGDEFSLRSRPSQVLSDFAPICTPLVMQSIARRNEEDSLLSPVCLQLDFQDSESSSDKMQKTSAHVEDMWDRRFSLSVQHILTKGKLEELEADEECANFMALQTSPISSVRHLTNPVAKVLTEGDLMHFVPIVI